MPSYLVHFNPYHNPKNGQFTFSNDSHKSLYKNIRKDVKKGTFNPEKYANNHLVRKSINDSNLVELTKKEEEARKAEKIYESEKDKYNSVIKKENELAEKYYKEMIAEAKNNGHFPLTVDEDYDIAEKARWKAEDEFRDKWKETYGKVDFGKLSGDFEKQAKDRLNTSVLRAQEYDKVVNDILGKYADKEISSLTVKEDYRKFVNDIVNKALVSEDNLSYGSTWEKVRAQTDELDNLARNEGFNSWDDVPEDHWLKRD